MAPREALPSQADAMELARVRCETLERLEAALRGSRDVAIIDAPNQRNVGDSLIWAGELAYLQKLGIRVRYVCDLWTFDPHALRKMMPVGTVLLHGGGNFGDLWPGHQTLREMVVSELHDYPIVQLPQSVFFNDPERASRANQVLGRHPDFLALIRDPLSLERATEQLPDVAVAFCPDAAFGWEAPSLDRRPQAGRVLVVARADKESMSGLHRADASWIPGAVCDITDWRPRGRDAVSWWFARWATLAYRIYVKVRKRWRWLPRGTVDRAGASFIDRINSRNIRAAVRLYSDAEVIVVDRLHAHVLAALLGVPHVVLDNNYRKVSSVYDAYSGRYSTAHYAADLDEARQMTKDMLGG